jgi:HD-like signal output (HDOD) protein
MQEILLQRIKQLPALPESAMQIEEVYQNEESSLDDMVKIVEKDPLLTAEIIKAANSPLYGFSRVITSVAQAVSMFGMGTVRGFALASIVKRSFQIDLSPYGISPEQFAAHSSMQNVLVTNWYLRKNPKLLGTLSPAAFLVDIGKVVISQYLKSEQKENDFQKKIAELGSVQTAEKSLCGVTSAEVSASIFDHWQFDGSLVNTIRCSLEPDMAQDEQTMAEILHVVRSTFTHDGKITQESSDEARELALQYNLDAAAFDDALEKLSA